MIRVMFAIKEIEVHDGTGWGLHGRGQLCFVSTGV